MPKANSWLSFVKEYKKKHPEMKLGDVMKACSKLWKKKKSNILKGKAK
jgi:hypothetical protein